MKRPKAGPELKMPELKAPDFLIDVFYDLRDRRLLPLVALAIVAIVAVPFLLGGGSAKPPPAPLGGPAPEPAGSGTSTLTVVQAQPGLREYSKRLRARTATDPFKQRYTAPDLAGTKLGSGAESSSGSSGSATSTNTTKVTKTTTNTSSGGTTKTTTESTAPGGEPTAPGDESTAPGGGGTASPHLTLYSFAIDVKILRTTSTPDGGKDQSAPEVRHRVIPPAALPSEKTQVVTYMGISPKTRRPLLLVSDAVTAVFGEAKCLSGAESCQLLEVEPGLPMTFVYGPDDARYKINVLKVEPVATGHS
jgi:hypothetical protein